MKDEGIKDEYDLKKFDEVLQESYMMIPDSERRLKESLKDLELFLDTNHDTLNKDNESYLEARTMVQNLSDKEGLVQETHVEDDADVF
jgi:tubulin-specific chaperone A